MLAGASWILRTWYRYHGDFQPASIGRLIEDVEVSEMRPKAVHLEGEILGRGVPGAFWSPDLVLRDSTGILFVLYRQSIPFARYFFAITAADSYVGQKVAIEGWFRRGLRPYVEMSTLTGEDGKTRRAYSRWVQYAVAAAVVVASWFWLAAAGAAG
jgi:heat shock protein HtpX